MGGTGAAMSGDLSAIFKDTALSSQRPDFQSFLKKGDERLKLLEQADRLPDLQSDFTTSQYKMVFRKSKALSSGLRPDQISPQKLQGAARGDGAAGPQGRRQLGADAAEGMEALEGGQTDPRWTPCSGRWRRCARRRSPRARARDLKGGRESNRGSAAGRDRAGVRAAARRIRTSARAKACCPARVAAARPRVRPPSGCAAIPTTSASRANRGAGARTATTPT
jgi:hypothetical protein